MTTIDELKRLHEAATSAPWKWQHQTDHTAKVAGTPKANMLYSEGEDFDVAAFPTKSAAPFTTTDAALIVALRNTIGDLLDVIEAADALVEGFEVEPDFEDCGVENCGDCAYMRRILDYRQARAELEE